MTSTHAQQRTELHCQIRQIVNVVLSQMSLLNPLYLNKKQRPFQQIVAFVKKFKGVGG